MMIHEDKHPMAGATVSIHPAFEYQNVVEGAVFRIEDWQDRVMNGSWMNASGNPAALGYALRAGRGGLPMDNEVVYGKINGLGYIIHVSELGETVS